MILVGRYISPFVRRVGVTLHLYGMAYERHLITIWDDLPDVKKYNPVGRVPALILDDGEVLIDSSAIIDYLDEMAGSARALTPPSGPERRRVQYLVALAVGVLEKTAHLVYEHSARPAEKYHQPWIARCQGQLDTAFAALDEVGLRPWLTGERMTQADVTAGVACLYLRQIYPAWFPEERYPNLVTLMDRCLALPAFAETKLETK